MRPIRPDEVQVLLDLSVFIKLNNLLLKYYNPTIEVACIPLTELKFLGTKDDWSFDYVLQEYRKTGWVISLSDESIYFEENK
jgi:hypothetical protein